MTKVLDPDNDGRRRFYRFQVMQRLLRSGQRAVGLDKLNAYYDPRLKAARLGIRSDSHFHFECWIWPIAAPSRKSLRGSNFRWSSDGAEGLDEARDQTSLYSGNGRLQVLRRQNFLPLPLG
jgi:hypothetical protein